MIRLDHMIQTEDNHIKKAEARLKLLTSKIIEILEHYSRTEFRFAKDNINYTIYVNNSPCGPKIIMEFSGYQHQANPEILEWLLEEDDWETNPKSLS